MPQKHIDKPASTNQTEGQIHIVVQPPDEPEEAGGGPAMLQIAENGLVGQRRKRSNHAKQNNGKISGFGFGGQVA